MNIYKTLYISIIWLLLFLFISLVFLIMGIRLKASKEALKELKTILEQEK